MTRPDLSVTYLGLELRSPLVVGAAAPLSEDLDEVLALSDRIAVIYEGRIAGLFDASEASLAEIGLLMTGGRPARAMEPTDATRLVP